MKHWIKSTIDRYLGLSFPARIGAAAVIGIIAGPGLLAFMTEFATYRYALHQGVRPPLEGIPYLKAAVALGSVTLSLIAAAVSLTVVWFAAKIASLVIRVISVFEKITDIYSRILDLRKLRLTLQVSSAIEGIRGLSFRKLLLVAAVVGVVFSSFGYGYTEFLLDLGVLVEGAEPTDTPADPTAVAWTLGIVGAVSILLLWRKHMVWFVAAGSVLILYALAFTSMFIPQYYGNVLRGVGYGGGIPIEVELEEPDSSGRTRYSKFLVLRTTTAVMLYDPTDDTIQEVPYSNIHSLRHEAAKLHSLQFMLPSDKVEQAGRDGQQSRGGEGTEEEPTNGQE